MKKGIILIIVIAFAVIVSCDNDFVTDILPVRNHPASAEIPVIPVPPDPPLDEGYTVVIITSGNAAGDTIEASPDKGKEGDTVTLAYTVANTAHYNLLGFGGVTVSIASVNSAESGERAYTINAADSSNGVITITAVFTHTDLELDPITFTDTGHINKTYGDVVFTNAVTAGYRGSGAITYSSSDTTVATVNGSGQVTILKAGSAIITAEKTADAVYALAQTNYTLTVHPKPVTITGLSAGDKVYDGTTTATVTGVAVIDGLVGGDDTVTIVEGTAGFEDKNVGTDKTVTFNGYSLGGDGAGNYTLSAQPVDVMADITAKPVTITGLSVANKQYDSTTAATVTGTAELDGVLEGDDVIIVDGTAAFSDKNAGTGKTVTFSGWSLGGANAGNYSVSAQPASVTANITAKPVTITGLSAANKQYDGTTAVTVTGVATISGKIATDTVTVSAGTASFASATVGNGKTVTFSGWSLSGADAGNYSLSAQPTVTANITAKPVTITGLSASNKVYDGTTTATVTGTAVISGLVSGDTVTVSPGSAAFANATVGTGKTVTFSGWSLTGADVGNYTLSAQPASVTATINLIDMVSIPAGTFTMGSPSSESGSYSDERPQHSVTLSGFSMGKYQVTQEQYEAVMGSNPSSFSSNPQAGEIQGKRPVESVSWYDALVFCNKLSVLEGLSPAYRISGSTDPAAWGTVPTSSDATWNAAEIVAGSNGYRLPTEAQWEYACRAGTTTAYNTGDTISDNTGWYAANSGSKTHQVGLKPANARGLYDMHGNVYEWCWDWYGSSYYSSSPVSNPMGASSGTDRVIRGAGWTYYPVNLRSAFRYYTDPSYRYNYLGFRLVRP